MEPQYFFAEIGEKVRSEERAVVVELVAVALVAVELVAVEGELVAKPDVVLVVGPVVVVVVVAVEQLVVVQQQHVEAHLQITEQYVPEAPEFRFGRHHQNP